MGSEPVVAETGIYSGTAVLQAEQNEGLDVHSLVRRGAARQGDSVRLHPLERAAAGARHRLRRASPDRRVSRQHPASLRRHPRRRAHHRATGAAAASGRAVHRAAAGRSRRSVAGCHPKAPRRDALPVDGRHRREGRLLLPHSEPGHRSSSSTTNPASPSTATSRPASISTPWFDRPTATTTGWTICANTTPSSSTSTASTS